VFENLARFEPLIPTVAPVNLADLDHGLRFYQDQRIEVWFSPMGELIRDAKLWILGITPGWRQMQIAYSAAADALGKGQSRTDAVAQSKPNVAFAGTMRSNLVAMMDQIGFPESFAVQSSRELFGSPLLRTGSVLKYPVFRGGKNYTGATPQATKHPVLMEMIELVLRNEIRATSDCLILPLGESVERVLDHVVQARALDDKRILRGLPHPSGANGHRHRLFAEHKHALRRSVLAWYTHGA
jgi:hypothetical protein